MTAPIPPIGDEPVTGDETVTGNKAATGDEPGVSWTRTGRVATVVFAHQARRNAMTLDMWRRVPIVCGEVANDDEVRAIVLRGAGRSAFVAGADISQFSRHRPGAVDAEDGAKAGVYDLATAAAFAAIAELAKPVVVAVHGFCIGGGLAMAVEADLRYAADDAVFGLPPARLGVGYSPAGIATLVDLIGPSRTKELIFTAEHINAETALSWGLVNAVFPKDDFDAMVSERVEAMASLAPLTQRAAKLAVARHLGSSAVNQGAADDLDALLASCATSQDYQEGIEAFLSKRKPVFGGF